MHLLHDMFLSGHHFYGGAMTSCFLQVVLLNLLQFDGVCESGCIFSGIVFTVRPGNRGGCVCFPAPFLRYSREAPGHGRCCVR